MVDNGSGWSMSPRKLQRRGPNNEMRQSLTMLSPDDHLTRGAPGEGGGGGGETCLLVLPYEGPLTRDV